jgi:hypothetical protein
MRFSITFLPRLRDWPYPLKGSDLACETIRMKKECCIAERR